MQKIFTVAAAALAGLTLSSGSALAGTPTIPEPTTLALLAAGVGALAVIKFRGRR